MGEGVEWGCSLRISHFSLSRRVTMVKCKWLRLKCQAVNLVTGVIPFTIGCGMIKAFRKDYFLARPVTGIIIDLPGPLNLSI